MKSWQISEIEIRAAVTNLNKELQEKRELYRERFHQALAVAAHCNLWKKAKWA
jgi:hypothetical protein